MDGIVTWPQPGSGNNFSGNNESGTVGRLTPILNDAEAVLRQVLGTNLNSLTIDRLVIGVFFVGVRLSSGFGGIAYTPPEIVRNAGRCILKSDSSTVRGMAVEKVMGGNVANPFAGVIRLATLNALSAGLFAEGRYTLDSGDLSVMARLFQGRRVCMVGAIIPLLKRLRELQPAGVTIIDHKKETAAEAEAGYGTFVSPEYTAEALAGCQTAVFTGAAIANGSMEGLIDLVPADAAIAVVGPTAGFIPEPLFQRNIAMIGTAMVTDSHQALEVLAEGGGAYQLFNGCIRKINLLNVPRLHQLGLMS